MPRSFKSQAKQTNNYKSTHFVVFMTFVVHIVFCVLFLQAALEPYMSPTTGLDEDEYQLLLTSLGSEDSPQARVSLSSFLDRFPAHLRPLVQPLFFQLARSPATGAAIK